MNLKKARYFKLVFVLGVLLVVAVVLLMLSIGYGPYRHAPSISGKLHRYNIGGKCFDFPRNYLRYASSDKSGYASLRTIYPSMKPYSDETRSDFDERGWGGGKISFSVSELSSQELIDDMIKKITANDLYKFTHEDGGYAHYRAFDSSSYQYLIPVKGPTKYFECSVTKNVEYPSCSTQLSIGDNLLLRYSFQSDLINSWEKIESKLIKLVLSFDCNR